MDSLSDQTVRIGLTGNGNERYYFQFSGLTWSFIYWDGSTLQAVATGQGATIGEYQWFEIYVSSQTVFFTIATKDNTSFYSGSASLGPFMLPGSTNFWQPYVWIQTDVAAPKTCQLDYWEWFDQEILYARLGNSHNLVHP
jgi:hypothetical protein